MKKLLLLFLFITSCKNVTEKEKAKVSSQNVISINDVLINDKKVLRTIDEFNKSYSHIDSIKTTLWECGQPFEWLDKEWMEDKYGKFDDIKGTFKNFDGKIKTFYVLNTEYNSNNHLVLFNNGNTKNNSLKIISKNIVLNANTTIEQFKKYFQQSKQENLANLNEFRFRLYMKNESEDAFIFDFKNGKLQKIILFWVLC